MSEINGFVEISKYAGERFDLVQAAGGNSSVKLNDTGEMLIKASGFLLSDVSKDNGYSRVLTALVADIVRNNEIISSENKRERESITSRCLKEATIDRENRPSIETLLHSLLLKYTLHTHSIVVNMIVVQDSWKEILNTIFKNNEIAFVKYETPGIELAIALDDELKRFDEIPNIIFLQNHGLIITSNNKDEIKALTEYVLDKIEEYLNIDMARYKLTSAISHLFSSINEDSNISYLSEDMFLNQQLKKNKKLFFKMPFCPDTLVYCGANPIRLQNLIEIETIRAYQIKHHELPKIILYNESIIFRAPSVKKAKEIEEVLRFHIMVLEQNKDRELKFLEAEELNYLSNWEAEKYRQKL